MMNKRKGSSEFRRAFGVYYIFDMNSAIIITQGIVATESREDVPTH